MCPIHDEVYGTPVKSTAWTTEAMAPQLGKLILQFFYTSEVFLSETSSGIRILSGTSMLEERALSDLVSLEWHTCQRTQIWFNHHAVE
jgi:hypothetical protein